MYTQLIDLSKDCLPSLAVTRAVPLPPYGGDLLYVRQLHGHLSANIFRAQHHLVYRLYPHCFEVLQGLSRGGVAIAEELRPQRLALEYKMRKRIVSLFADVATGIAHLHKCRILHLDVKPENMLASAITFTHPKESRPNTWMRGVISDLGHSRALPTDKHKITFPDLLAHHGTRAYRAPEAWSPAAPGKEPYACDRSDVFSLAVSLCICLTGTVLDHDPKLLQLGGAKASRDEAAVESVHHWRVRPVPAPQDRRALR